MLKEIAPVFAVGALQLAIIGDGVAVIVVLTAVFGTAFIVSTGEKVCEGTGLLIEQPDIEIPIPCMPISGYPCAFIGRGEGSALDMGHPPDG